MLTRIRASTATASSGPAITRVEVELGDLVVGIDHGADPDEEIFEGGQVGGRLASKPGQKGEGRERADRLGSLGPGDRADPHADVAEQLGLRPAGAAGEDRAEHRVADHPAVLEGGYDVEALAESVAATLAALGGEGESVSAAPDPILTSRAAAQLARYWPL